MENEQCGLRISFVAFWWAMPSLQLGSGSEICIDQAGDCQYT